MSKELDDLLKAFNDAQGGRQVSDIPTSDPYWAAGNAYRAALHAADGVHVPVEEEKKEEIIEEEKKELTEEEKTLEQLKTLGIQ